MRLFIVIISLVFITASASAQKFSPESKNPFKITTPNGGEKLLIGHDTLITWRGIPFSDTVKIDYSTDNGSSWNTIAKKTTSGKYLWHVPNTSGQKCIARVEQLSIPGQTGWVKPINVFGVSNTITTDKFGNCFVAGSGDTIPYNWGFHSFIKKYAPDGTQMWVKETYGAPGIQNIGSEINGIVIDTAGNVIIVGYFTDTISLDGVKLLAGVDRSGFFIAKYGSNGTLLWAKKMVGSGIGGVGGNSIVCDPQGNILIAGVFYGSIDFGGKILTATGGNSLALAKYASDGLLVWAKGISTFVNLYGNILAIDNFGDFFISGTFYDKMDFGGGIILTPNKPFDPNLIENNDNIYIAKYHSDGSLEWAKHPGGSGRDGANYASTDAFGNCYVTGTFQDTIDFGGIQLLSNDIASDVWYGDLFLAKYHPDGSVEWAKNASTDTSHFISPSCMTSDSLGEIWITGTYNDTIDFKGTLLPSNGREVIFLAKYSSNGDLISVEHDGGHGTDYNYIASSPRGDIFLTTWGQIQNSDTLVFEQDTLIASNDYSSFLWKIPSNIVQSTISDSVFSIIDPSGLDVTYQKSYPLISISPNPSLSFFHAEIYHSFPGITQLFIMNLLGVRIAMIFNGELTPGSHSFDFNTTSLPAGSYFLVMQTPASREIQKLIIER